MIPMYADMGRDKKETWIKETSKMKLFNHNKDGELLPFSKITHTQEEPLNKKYPFKAILGSSRYHLGSGTRTGLSDRLKDFKLKGDVGVSFADLDRLKIDEGDKVKISSPYGKIERIIKADKGVKQGLIFIPMAFHSNDAMELIKLNGLEGEDSSGWKSCDVRIDKSVD